MNHKQLFQKYRARLVRIGMVKALLCSLSVGLAVSFLVAMILWMTAVDGLGMVLGLPIGLGVAAVLLSHPVFYFYCFRPNSRDVARKVDRLGLEERLVTMLELRKDDSYIASLLREDAEEQLKGVETKRLGYMLSRVAIIVLAVACVFGISMTTVSVLAEEGVFPAGSALNPFRRPPERATITYVAQTGGYIEGNQLQSVVLGEFSATVYAMPEDGYVFYAWDDGVTTPVRTDRAYEKITYTAIFVEAPFFGGVTGSPDLDYRLPGKDDGGKPDPDEPPKDIPPESPPSNSDFTQNNNIIDGNTNYRDIYEGEGKQYERLLDRLTNDSTLSDEERAIIEAYLKTIK